MTRAGIHRQAAWRGAFLTLAVLALMMKIAAPPGFMFAAPGSGSSFALVICTGHAPADKGDLGKGDHGNSRADAPCAFAGHAAPSTPSAGAPLLGSAFVEAVERSSAQGDLTPGRGLAAPPPPSRGPPIFL